MSRRWDAVLLDLDGTLLDTHGLILASFRHTRDALGLAADDDAFRRGMGRPLFEVFRGLCASDAQAEEAVAVYRAHNGQVHDAMVRPFPGVEAAIDALRAAGVRIAVVTSKSAPFAERGLAVTGLRGRIDALVTPSDVTRPKPDPEPVQVALHRLGVGPERAVMVGDSPHDLEAGRAARVDTAWVAWGPFSAVEVAACAPDHVLGSPNDLVALALAGR